MYEYVTVSASSYDPGSLATKLTEKSAEGWEVVSIVPTGGDVTAFCRRAAGAVEPVAATTTAEPETSIEELAAAIETAEPAPAFTAATAEPEPVSTSPWAATAEVVTAPEPAAAPPAEVAAYAPTAAAQPAQPAQPVQAQPPAQPQVPAGWYSDPSGRFELRYWDGNGWTEHVARGGQQSTDPPVA